MRGMVLVLAGLLLGACASTGGDGGDVPSQQPLPGELRFVGEPGPGARVSATLAAEAIAVTGAYSGRAAGIDAFCSGGADGLVLSSDLNDAERATCKGLGGNWSALSGLNLEILYIRYFIADAFLDRSTAF
jgi:hypothetical protein